MRLVDRPTFRPMRCAAVPQLGATARCRWVDTGAEMPGFDNHIYLSEPAVLEAAKLFGFPTPAEYESVVAERDELEARVEELEREASGLQEAFDAIDVLASRDFRARKKPGKRPAERVAA